MAKVSDGIKHTGGHYEKPLPFRQSEVKLPNNRQQAFKRALWQRKMMLQNQQYRSDYVAFITDMIDQRYAEKVPHESLKTIFLVLVPIDQRDFLRFLWWPNGDLSAELEEYRMMRVHPFGAVSSPSCSNYALHVKANEVKREYGNEVAEVLRRNFYVDDCLRSVGTEGKAIGQIAGLRQAFRKGGFLYL